MIPFAKRKIKFIKVYCKGCKNEQIMYTFSTTRVTCFHCGCFISIPKGGKCELVDATVKENLK